MMSEGEETTTPILATKCARRNLVYGDLHLPPLPHIRLRPPEYHEAEKEDKAVSDLDA
jgi:hypothetical protein